MEKIFSTSNRALKHAYTKAISLYGTLAATTTTLYLNTQRIAESYVPNGIWNAEAWRQSWGADGVQAGISLIGAGIVGLITLLSTPTKFSSLYSNSHKSIKLDKENKKITQIKLSRKGKERTMKEIEYDAILSAYVIQGPLERKVNVGTINMTTVRLNEEKDKKGVGHMHLEEEFISIPLQENPYELKKEILEGEPGYKELKKRLRGN